MPTVAVNETSSNPAASDFLAELSKQGFMDKREVDVIKGQLLPLKPGCKASYGLTRTGKLDHILKIAERVQDFAEYGIQKVIQSGDIDGDTLDLDQIQINLDAIKKQLLDKVSSLRPSPGFLEKLKDALTKDSDVDGSFGDIETKPVSNDEKKYSEMKAKVENHFAIAKSKIQSFRDPIAIATLKKALKASKGAFPSIFYYFTKQYPIILKFNAKLDKAKKQLELDPENKTLIDQIDDINSILVAADKGASALKTVSARLIGNLKRAERDSSKRKIYSSNPTYNQIKDLHLNEQNKSKKYALHNLGAALKLINMTNGLSVEESDDSNDPVFGNNKTEANSKINAGLRYLVAFGGMAYETGNLMGLFGTAYGVTSTAATEGLPYLLTYGLPALRVASYGAVAFYPEKVQRAFTAGINTVSSIKNFLNPMKKNATTKDELFGNKNKSSLFDHPLS